MSRYTTWEEDELELVLEIVNEEKTKKEAFKKAGEILGRSQGTVSATYYKQIYKKEPAEYALYKGEEILIVGTIDEIAEARGVKRETLFHYGTPAYSKRSKNGMRLTKL